jgi:hypothetical protein
MGGGHQERPNLMLQTIKQIMALSAGQHTEGVRATLMEVGEPYPPSEKQLAAGIHKQSILVADDTGQMEVEIIDPSKHIDRGRRGSMVLFMSGEKSNGQKIGLKVDEWEGNKKVVLSRDGYVKVEEDAPPASFPVPAAEEEGKTWFEEQAKAHFAIYEVVCKAYAGRGVPVEALKDITTSLYIEGNRKGKSILPPVKPQERPQPAKVAPMEKVATTPPAPAQEPEGAFDVASFPEMSDDQIRATAYMAFMGTIESRELMQRQIADRDITYESCLPAVKAWFIGQWGEEKWKNLVKEFIAKTGAKKHQKEELARAILLEEEEPIQ